MTKTKLLFLSTLLLSTIEPWTTTSRAAAQPETEPAPSPVVEAGAKGFSIKDGDDPPAYVLKFMATLQVDGRLYFNDPSLDTVLLRRARPILGGTVLGLVDFYLAPDFGAGNVLFDAYLDIHPWSWLRLRTGKFKSPIGFERLQNDPDLPLPERGLTSDLTPVRDVGAQFWGEVGGGMLTYALAVLAGAPDSGNVAMDNGRHKDLAADLLFRPLAGRPELGSFGVALAATTGRRDGTPKDTSLVPYKTVGQTTAFAYLQSTTDTDSIVFAIGRQSRINPGLYYYYGPFGALTEAVWSRQHVRKGDVGRSLTHRAWHATASYVIGGTNGYTGATPYHDWNPASRHFGALELSARIGQLQLDPDSFPTFADPTASARRATSLGFSANWVLSRMFRAALAYEQTWFVGGAGEANAITNRGAENFLLTRAQLNF